MFLGNQKYCDFGRHWKKTENLTILSEISRTTPNSDWNNYEFKYLSLEPRTKGVLYPPAKWNTCDLSSGKLSQGLETSSLNGIWSEVYFSGYDPVIELAIFDLCTCSSLGIKMADLNYSFMVAVWHWACPPLCLSCHL